MSLTVTEQERLSEAYSDLKDKYTTLRAQFRALQKEKSTDEQVKKLKFRIGELESEIGELKDQIGEKPKGQSPPKGWTQEFARDYLVVTMKSQLKSQMRTIHMMREWREKYFNLRARIEMESRSPLAADKTA